MTNELNNPCAICARRIGRQGATLRPTSQCSDVKGGRSTQLLPLCNEHWRAAFVGKSQVGIEIRLAYPAIFGAVEEESFALAREAE